MITAIITIMMPSGTLSPEKLMLSNKTRSAPHVPRKRLKIFYWFILSSGSIKYEKIATVSGNPDQIIEDKLE